MEWASRGLMHYCPLHAHDVDDHRNVATAVHIDNDSSILHEASSWCTTGRDWYQNSHIDTSGRNDRILWALFRWSLYIPLLSCQQLLVILVPLLLLN